MMAAIALENSGVPQDGFKVRARQIFQFQKMFHGCKAWEMNAQRILFT
jgi:hypothetical protein